MALFWQQIVGEWPSTAEMLVVAFRLLVAAVAGALPGIERERKGMPAGLRTHLLVSLGAAVFVMASLESGATAGETTRVVQGLATGIGFVGAGAILKSRKRIEVQGLTTAASIWLTAALGTAAGLGQVWLPLLASILALAVLAVLWRVEAHAERGSRSEPPR